MSNNRITPFVKRMRTNGGTIYTFSSAVEDIGLNINERNNVVKISHFALLDIPTINYPDSIEENRFNSYNGIAGSFEYNYPGNPSLKDGRVLIAESFQNYALNLESNFLNQPTYNATLTRTVTERVFWKWLKETGAIRWDKDVSANGVQYWSEELDADGSLGYNTVVKYIGQVSAGNVRSDSFGTYNETYILVPTSHGQMDAYFQIIEDDNYHHNMEIGDLGEKILGREGYTLPQPDGLSYNAYYDFVDSSEGTSVGGGFTMDYSLGSYTPGWWYTAEGIEPTSVDNAYLTDSSSYITSGIYNTDLKYTGSTTIEFRRSNIDCLSLVFDIEKLKGIYADPALTYDKMAIQDQVNDAFNFNAVLIYYTVYNSTMDEVLGRNLLGVLFIDAPSGNSSSIGSSGIIIPSLEKIASGPGGFGTSYSLRLNIKTDNMVDDTTATIVDMATSDQLYAEDWTEAFANLNTAVNILTQNNSTINYISGQYVEVQETQTQILNDLQALQWQVNDIGRDITGTANTLALFADGDDPLVDSSVYMRFGNVGVHINEPKYPFHVVGDTKVDDIIIENAVRDTSGNVLLGYGSPLQLGASTNNRAIDMYAGGLNPLFHLDSSGLSINTDVSISTNLYVDGSAFIEGLLVVESIFSPTFDFDSTYIKDTSNGSTLFWINGFLEVSLGSSVSADGSTGAIQFANNAGLLSSDSARFYYDSSFGRLGLHTRYPAYTLDVSGMIYARSNAIIGGNTTVLGSLSVGSTATITGALGVPSISNSIRVDGSLNVTGNYYKNNVLFGEPGGSSTQIQFNDGGVFGGDTGLVWDKTNNILTILPGNTAPTQGAARLGMANFAQGTAMESDYLYTGAAILGNGSNLGYYWSGWVSKSYRGTNTDYSYSHIGVTDVGQLYFKYNDDNVDSTAASGGNWTQAFDNRHTLTPFANSTIDLGNATSRRFRNLYFTPSAASTSNVLYYNSTTGAVTYGTGGGGVNYVGGTDVNNYILTATGFNTVQGESNLQFDGTQLTFAQGGTRTIKLANPTSVVSGYTLAIVGSNGVVKGSGKKGTNGGLITIDAGDAGVGAHGSGSGGSIYIRGGTGATGSGRTYIYNVSGGTTYLGNNGGADYNETHVKRGDGTSPGLGFRGLTTGFFSTSSTTLGVALNNAERYRFAYGTSYDFHALGDIVAYSTVPSDIRIKKDIRKIENSLDKVLKLNPISYIRKNDETEKTRFGFIAQEAEKILPEVIQETTLLGEKEGEMFKTVRYTEIIPVLTGAIKELKAEIESLKAELNELKNK